MNSNPEIRKIEIGQNTLKHLNTLRKWTMFLAVSGFIFLGLIITLGLITSTFLTAFNQTDKTSGIPDILVFAAFIGLTLITFFPVLFLFRFSKHIMVAVSTLDSEAMHKAIKSLKRFFIYLGVVLILAVSIYFIALILDSTTTGFLRRL